MEMNQEVKSGKDSEEGSSKTLTTGAFKDVKARR
jgi:hypothetical protein